jgi:hypothetical protein
MLNLSTKVDCSCSHAHDGKAWRIPCTISQVQDQQHGNSGHLSAWGIVCHRSLQGRILAQHCRQNKDSPNP